MKRYLTKDISGITSIKNNVIQKLNHIGELCICDYINELDMLNEDVLQIDIGIGIISILVKDDELEYSFYPSNTLEKSLIRTIEKKESPLVKLSEINLENKINSTYKDIM